MKRFVSSPTNIVSVFLLTSSNFILTVQLTLTSGAWAATPEKEKVAIVPLKNQTTTEPSKAPPQSGTVYKVISDASTVTFKAVGKPGFLRVNGEGAKASGEIKLAENKATGKIEVLLDQYVTGIEMRDKHMKEKYLETGKYPKAELIIENQVLDISKGGEQDFSGTLNLHGKSSKVAGKITIKKDQNKVLAQAQFDLILSDYGIEIPEYLGVTIASKVGVEANLSLQQ